MRLSCVDELRLDDIGFGVWVAGLPCMSVCERCEGLVDTPFGLCITPFPSYVLYT